jgi:endonuclease YncB( thermonuclease family)
LLQKILRHCSGSGDYAVLFLKHKEPIIFMMRLAKQIKLLALAIAVLGVAVASAENITGEVIGVMDGDTIEVLDASKTPRRIRLVGIDAPEKAQAFGNKSKQHLSDLVFGQQVEVQSRKKDELGRMLGKVVVSGKDANLEQVRAGFAWHYKNYQKEQSASDRLLYADAETAARNRKSGLWFDAKPMPPWEWRHGGKDVPTIESTASGCPCGGATLCTGVRGGEYCIKPNGKKRY